MAQTARVESALISQNLNTTSLIVAEKFSKRHKDVLRKIEALELPAEYHRRNFTPMAREVKIGSGATRQSKYCELTRDGWSVRQEER